MKLPEYKISIFINMVTLKTNFLPKETTINDTKSVT